LFNRVYLNYHPNPHPQHFTKYIIPRYVTGNLYRDKESFTSIETSLELIKKELDSDLHFGQDQENLIALQNYIFDFCKQFNVGISVSDLSS